MEKEWLADGEQVAGTWHVYVGGETPNAAKITGQLHVTDRNVHFEAGISLKENAAADISNRIRAFAKSDTHVTVPFGEIAAVSIARKFLILKSLVITLKSGGELAVHFGAMSPQAALDAISSRLTK